LKISDIAHFYGPKGWLKRACSTDLSIFKLFLDGNKEFSSCSHLEICKFHFTEDKANAHADMPFCGVSQFAVQATALLGRGSFAFIGKRLCRAPRW